MRCSRATARACKWGLVLTVVLGAAVHLRAGHRIFARRLRLLRQHLWRHLLHGDRLPRLPRAHRHDLPDRLPDPRHARRVHAATITSASNLPPGTGTSSTWSGCSCSPRSMSGAAGAWRSTTADGRGIEIFQGRGTAAPLSFRAAAVTEDRIDAETYDRELPPGSRPRYIEWPAASGSPPTMSSP